MKCRSACLVGATVIGSIVFTLLLLELALQILPTRSYLPYAPVTYEDPVVRYWPNTSYTYSAGWNFDAYNKGRTNTQGYIADYDFDGASNKPLIGVVGDSFIEARMVPFKDTLQERLRTALEDKIRVYGVAMHGAPLSQYLIFARMMRDTYKPGMMIVNIIANDFDESLPRYKDRKRFHYFIEDENGALKPALIGEYNPSWIKRMISSSALVNYVYLHLNLVEIVSRKERDKRMESSNDHTSRIDASMQAIDAFLNLLPEYAGLPNNRILLIVDGQRSMIYSGATQTVSKQNYFGYLRHYLITESRKKGYEIIDMHPVFEADYVTHHKAFEFEYDPHWNGYAHGLAAQAVQESKTLGRFKASLR